MCEESLGVLSSTAGYRALRSEGTVAETLDVVPVNQWEDVLIVETLNLVILVRSAETVEEVHEGNLSLQTGEVGNSGHIHDFLYRTFAKHGETSLTASHYVLMVTEDTERVAGQRTGRNVEYAGEQLTGNLVHVRNHQKKTLRSREGSGQGTSLERTMNCTGSTTL